VASPEALNRAGASPKLTEVPQREGQGMDSDQDVSGRLVFIGDAEPGSKPTKADSPFAHEMRRDYLAMRAKVRAQYRARGLLAVPQAPPNHSPEVGIPRAAPRARRSQRSRGTARARAPSGESELEPPRPRTALEWRGLQWLISEHRRELWRTTRVCPRCRDRHPLEDFGGHRYCRPCKAADMRERRAAKRQMVAA
jgi:hypothetical protein